MQKYKKDRKDLVKQIEESLFGFPQGDKGMPFLSSDIIDIILEKYVQDFLKKDFTLEHSLKLTYQDDEKMYINPVITFMRNKYNLAVLNVINGVKDKLPKFYNPSERVKKALIKVPDLQVQVGNVINSVRLDYVSLANTTFQEQLSKFAYYVYLKYKSFIGNNNNILYNESNGIKTMALKNNEKLTDESTHLLINLYCPNETKDDNKEFLNGLSPEYYIHSLEYSFEFGIKIKIYEAKDENKFCNIEVSVYDGTDCYYDNYDNMLKESIFDGIEENQGVENQDVENYLSFQTTFQTLFKNVVDKVRQRLLAFRTITPYHLAAIEDENLHKLALLYRGLILGINPLQSTQHTTQHTTLEEFIETSKSFNNLKPINDTTTIGNVEGYMNNLFYFESVSIDISNHKLGPYANMEYIPLEKQRVLTYKFKNYMMA